MTIQNIFFDENGTIVDSDENIFPLSVLDSKNVGENFPFIDSILPQLQAMKPQSSEMFFPRVEVVFRHLDGIYDYTFCRIERNGKNLIQWKLCDRTNHYLSQKSNQQSLQEEQINQHFTFK